MPTCICIFYLFPHKKSREINYLNISYAQKYHIDLGKNIFSIILEKDHSR